MAGSQDLVQLLLVAQEELLNALDFFLQLNCYLIHLRTLHVVVINLIPTDWSVDSLFLLSHYQLVMGVVAVGKFIDHELLH